MVPDDTPALVTLIKASSYVVHRGSGSYLVDFSGVLSPELVFVNLVMT